MLPQYQKMKNHICREIDTGAWQEGHRISSENQLAEQFQVSRMTANRALKELTQEGILTRVPGVGTFVAPQIPQTPLFEIKNIAQEIRARGHTHSAGVVLLDRESASELTALELEIPVGTAVFHSLVIHRENGVPVQLEDRYVNPARAPDYLDQDFTHITPSEYLLSIAPLSEAEHIIEAILPDRATRALLGLKQNEPCLLLHRRTWSGNTLTTTARLIHPGSRYRLGGRFIPQRARHQKANSPDSPRLNKANLS